MTPRLAIVASHPIQYQAPWFRELACRPELEIEVLYGHRASPREQADAGFGVPFEWDTPLLAGYPSRLMTNVATEPSVNTFQGVDTPEAERVLRAGSFDAVLVSGWHTRSYVQAIRGCWSNKIPVMVRSDSHLHQSRPWHRRVVKALPYRYFIPRFDACLAAGTWSRDYFLNYGARPERVFIVPHTVVAGCELSSQSRRESSRRRWNLDPETCVFLFAGKLMENKRPLDFVKAIAQASRAANVAGLIAGDGPLRHETELLAAELNAPVRFTGFLNQREMPDAYAASDALCLPSTRDTWGLVVNEAMGWGLPCVVSDLVGCGPDLIEDDVTGFVFPAGDVDRLSARMLVLASDPAKRTRMGDLARQRMQSYSPAAAADALIRALYGVLGR